MAKGGNLGEMEQRAGTEAQSRHRRTIQSGRRARPRLRIAGLLLLGSIALLVGCAKPKTAEVRQPEPEAPAIGLKSQEALDRKTVARAQRGLTDLGYQPGPVDGLMGPRTRTAIRTYQKSAGLPATGMLSRRLVERIEAEGKALARSATPAAPAPEAPRAARHDAGLPLYEVGSTYVYSDGRIETVVGLKGDLVRWQRQDGTRFSAHRNFLLGPTYWQSGRERGTKALNSAPGHLWPRETGAAVAYSADIQVQLRDAPADLNRWQENWRCRFDGNEELTVAAGPFETLRFTCLRDASEERPALERVWSYAPAVGHYVQLTEKSTGDGQQRQVELVAIQPNAGSWPAIVRSALGRALVRVLERSDTDASVPWASSGIETVISLRATSDLRRLAGQPCRSYLQVWRDSTGERRYPGAACRSAPGRWAIPGLSQENEGQLAVSN